MEWLEVSIVTDGEAAEAVAEVLRPFAYNDGVVLEQLGDDGNPDPGALSDQITVKIYLPEQEDTPAQRRRLVEILYHMNRLYPIPAPSFRRLAEADWAVAWRSHYRPFRVGRRLWIRPSWEADAAPAPDRSDDVVLTLDPGMAFGTGTHPTTQMCLQALETLVRPGHRVLDVGTGSGILAIAAARLGAGQVAGIDTDDVAVRTAVANADANGVARRLQLWQGTLASVAPQTWDLVVVNILAPIIVHLLAADNLLARVAPAGHLIMSGIIDEQAEDVERALATAGGQMQERLAIRDWVTLIAGHARPGAR